MERILQRDSLHKPMVTSLQTGSRENTTQKYNNYPKLTSWFQDEEHKRNNGSTARQTLRRRQYRRKLLPKTNKKDI